jgi:hypothetical protein
MEAAMAFPTTTVPDDKKNPTAYRVEFSASNGYTLDERAPLFHNKAKADKYAETLILRAKAHNVASAKAMVVPLYKDKDNGLLLPGKDMPCAGYSLGKI